MLAMIGIFLGGMAAATIGWIFAAHYANPRGKAQDAMEHQAHLRGEEHLEISREMLRLMYRNAHTWDRIAQGLRRDAK